MALTNQQSNAVSRADSMTETTSTQQIKAQIQFHLDQDRAEHIRLINLINTARQTIEQATNQAVHLQGAIENGERSLQIIGQALTPETQSGP